MKGIESYMSFLEMADNSTKIEMLKALKRNVCDKLDKTTSARDTAALTRQLIILIGKIEDAECDISKANGNNSKHDQLKRKLGEYRKHERIK